MYMNYDRNKGTVQFINAALKAVGAGGLMGIAVVAPNMALALDRIGVFSSNTPSQLRRRCLAELKRQGLIITSHEDDNLRLQLTVKGIHRLQKLEIDELEIKTPRKWDKKWRMVMFDIPARRKESRYLLLSQLRRLGFVMIQNSLWIHPYPCFEIVERVVRYSNLQQFVSVAEICRLDEHATKRLLTHFPTLYS